MSRHTIIVVLVGINLIFLAGIVLSVTSPSAAMAQRVGGAGNYMIVAAEVMDGNDAVYVFDLPERRLHAFTVKKGTPPRIELRDTRDLSQDFRAR